MKELSHFSQEPPIARLAVKREEAARILSISSTTFDEWVRRTWMPQGIKLEGLRLWDYSELYAAWQHIRETNCIIREDDGKNPFDDIVG